MFRSDVTGRGKKRNKEFWWDVHFLLCWCPGKKWDEANNLKLGRREKCGCSMWLVLFWSCQPEINRKTCRAANVCARYHCCSNYICSLPPPVINNESQLLFSSDITVMEIKNLIKGFCLYLVYYISLKNLAKYLKNPEKSRKSLKSRKNLKKI